MRTYDCKRCNESLDRFTVKGNGFCTDRCLEIYQDELAVGEGEMTHEEFVDCWGFQPEEREP